MEQKLIHIALVDDDELVVQTLKDHIEHLGHRCSSFTDSKSALDFIFSDKTVDIFITDIRMPEVSGLELVRNVRSISGEIPIILITAYGDIEITLDALGSGATDYISKPFEIKDIKKSIERITRQRSRGLKYIETTQYVSEASFHYQMKAKDVDVVSISSHISDFLYSLKFYNLTEKLNFALALNEALINANDHGNLALSSSLKETEFDGEDAYNDLRKKHLEDPVYADRVLDIRFESNQETATITITDEGAGFNVDKVMNIDPLQAFMNETNHGRGLALMRLYTDDIAYNKTGNQIIITKHKQD